MTTAETERVHAFAMCAMAGQSGSSNLKLMRLRSAPRIKEPPTSDSADEAFEIPWPDNDDGWGTGLVRAEEWLGHGLGEGGGVAVTLSLDHLVQPPRWRKLAEAIGCALLCAASLYTCLSDSSDSAPRPEARSTANP